MTIFLRRFFGALVLDAGAFEDIEADRGDAFQSLAVVVLAAAAGGVAAMGLGVVGMTGFIAGAVLVIAGWLVWISAISVIGTIALPEPQTRSNMSELARTLGFATAPGVFIAFAAMRSAAPFVVTLVALWMLADTVLAMRQALDYRSTARALAVSLIAFIMSAGIVAAIGYSFTIGVN